MGLKLMFTIAITPGCPSGIGPEVFSKALNLIQVPPSVKIILCDELRSSLHKGNPSQKDLTRQRDALLKAVTLIKSKEAHAIVTGPVRKKALWVNQHQFQGQTEFLHHFLPADEAPPLMCFMGESPLLGLASVHIPLKDVPHSITAQGLEISIKRLHRACMAYYNIKDHAVRIAVLGLNPHAGENGLLGQEEINIIAPAIAQARLSGINAIGPLSPDGFFGNLKRLFLEQRYHGVLAMYHDQGLAPYKLLYGDKLVNVTLGLQVIRTSPAHGTADDIAGQNKADPSSAIAAIQMAISLTT